MYNETVKNNFIENYLESRNVAKTAVESVFESSAKSEEVANNHEGKDICNFSKSEIIDFYKSLRAKSKERLSFTNSILKEYKSWATDNGFCYDDYNYYDTFTIDDFKTYISKNILENKYIGEETLDSYLEEISNPCDKLLLILLYNGIKGKSMIEIINLHVDQIEGNTLHLCTGRDVKVSDDVIKLIIETDNTYVYFGYGKKNYRYNLYGEKVFKSTKKTELEDIASIYHKFTVKMTIFQKMFDNPELAINRISISGMLNAILKKSKAMDMPIREFLFTPEAGEILEQYEFNRNPTKVLKLYGEFLDYIK